MVVRLKNCEISMTLGIPSFGLINRALPGGLSVQSRTIIHIMYTSFV